MAKAGSTQVSQQETANSIMVWPTAELHEALKKKELHIEAGGVFKHPQFCIRRKKAGSKTVSTRPYYHLHLVMYVYKAYGCALYFVYIQTILGAFAPNYSL